MAQDYVVGPAGPGGGNNAGHGAALYLPNRKHPAVMIQNTGSNVLYANPEDPINGPSAGQPVSAGSTLGWDENLPLFVTSPLGTTMTITENTGSLFDVGAIANQIAIDLTTSGLAAAIASAIYITGTPPVDKLTLLASPNAPGSTAILDVSSYVSISIALYQTGIPTSYLYGSIQWLDTLNNVIGVDAFNTGAQPLSNGIPTRVDIPVRGPRFQLTVTSPYSVGGAGGKALVYGSFKPRTDISYFSGGAGSANGATQGGGTSGTSAYTGTQAWNGTIPSATTWAWEPDVVAGPATLTLRFTGVATGKVDTSILMPPLVQPLSIYDGDFSLITTSSVMQKYQLKLSANPLQVTIANNNTGALSQTFRATLAFGNPYNS